MKPFSAIHLEDLARAEVKVQCILCWHTAPLDIAPLIERFGTTRLIGAGVAYAAAGHALFLPVVLESGYAVAVLPTFVLAGLGFGLAYGPLNVAATNGVAPDEQGLAGGLVNTSFQFGGALVLAIVTAVNNAATGPQGSGLLDGFHAATIVSLIVAVIGVAATTFRRRARLASEVA